MLSKSVRPENPRHGSVSDILSDTLSNRSD